MGGGGWGGEYLRKIDHILRRETGTMKNSAPGRMQGPRACPVMFQGCLLFGCSGNGDFGPCFNEIFKVMATLVQGRASAVRQWFGTFPLLSIPEQPSREGPTAALGCE